MVVGACLAQADDMPTLTLSTAEPHAIPQPAVETPLRVLIADDHPLYRRGLSRAMRRAPELELVGEAADGDEALQLVAALRPDVVVLDQRMPGVSGLEAARRLRAAGPGPAVVLLTAFDDAEMRALAAEAGASWVPKTATTAEILTVVRAARR